MTEPSDELDRRFRAALPEPEEQDCPPPDDLWAAAAGELPFERVRALADHGARCARCAEAWRILADVRRAAAEHAAEAAPSPVEPRATPARPRLRTRTLLPLAVSALAAVGVWVVLRPPPVWPPPVERGSGGSGLLRAESPEVQRAREAVLRWSEVPGASAYNVTVLTLDLVVVHQAMGVTGHQLALPESVRQRGGGLLWNVDAVLPDGRTVPSPTFELQLK